MPEQDSGPGWSLADERRLGDHLQQVINEGGSSRDPEDEAAEQLMKATLDEWPSYETGDDE